MPSGCRCGQCEMRWLAPFVRRYNRVRICDFVLDRRLDATGPAPQPEAAYVDANTRDVLVIERKSVIWPPDFAQLHATSHEVCGIVDAALGPVLEPNRAYRLTLRDDLRGPRKELQAYARRIGRAIADRLDAVHNGTALRARWPNREWSFLEEPVSERDFTEPSTGLIVEFKVRTSELDVGEVSAGLVSEFERLLVAAARKFEEHAAARRILVLDPYADVRWSTDDTWRKLLASVVVPAPIQEIWISMHAMLTELHCGWIQQQLWPVLGEDYSELCHDPEPETGAILSDDSSSPATLT